SPPQTTCAIPSCAPATTCDFLAPTRPLRHGPCFCLQPYPAGPRPGSASGQRMHMSSSFNPIVFALRRPVTVLAGVAALAVGSLLAVQRMAIDIFPSLDLPVIY